MLPQDTCYSPSRSTGIYGSYLYTDADWQRSNAYLDDDNKTYIDSHSTSYNLNDIDDEKSEMTEQFQIASAVDLKLNYQIKSNALPDESGFNVVPMNIYDEPKPVMSFTLDVSYDNWTSTLQDEFLAS